MSAEQPNDASYDLVIPFVACTSHGGLYDDRSFSAGYQAGRIDHALAVVAAVGGSEAKATVATALVHQLDLIAMHHGFTVNRAEYEQAKADDRVDHLLDTYLSDMDERTTVTEPDGTTYEPYGDITDTWHQAPDAEVVVPGTTPADNGEVP